MEFQGRHRSGRVVWLNSIAIFPEIKKGNHLLTKSQGKFFSTPFLKDDKVMIGDIRDF